MSEAKLSSKNQIVLPREARDTLHVGAGEKLLVIPRDNIVVLLRKPKKYSQALLGIAKGLYPSGYLKKERDSWR